jgi:hypothetical protein
MQLDCIKKIEELSLVSLSKMLFRFFVMVCNKDGLRYLTSSLMNLDILMNRMLVKAQENWICSMCD